MQGRTARFEHSTRVYRTDRGTRVVEFATDLATEIAVADLLSAGQPVVLSMSKVQEGK